AAARHPVHGGGGPLLLLPGRGTRLKGHADALALLARLRAHGIDARLWLAGAREPHRAAYVAELEGEAARLGVAEAIALTEPTDAIARAYAAADLVLQLSRKPEAFGRTALEALAVGRPVLGWHHGGVGELLAQWQPEGAVAPFDADALERAARALLAHPPAPADTMRLFAQLSLRAMQEATLAVYAELADAAPRR
ncbi:glycosyltransferase, partial [Vulcaniibacterium tengchongense]|uniref:glycosyltransferase n=1 Tax=Vulcaniibacterium tengchongense TaxID=1273429 RepID=UPI0011CAE2E1